MLFGLLVNGGQFPGAGWTVIVEFQFYLLFPFLLTFTRRYGLRYLFGLLAVAMALRALFWARVGNIQYLAYSTPFGRIDQFLFGILAFHLYRSGKVPRSPLAFISVTLIWMLIYHQFNRMGGYYHSTRTDIWIYLPTLEGLFYGLMTATYLSARISIPRSIDRVVAWLGTISYSMYLAHTEVMMACSVSAGKFGFPITNPQRAITIAFAVDLPLLIALSAATYYVIERPFLSLRHSYLAPSETAPAVQAG